MNKIANERFKEIKISQLEEGDVLLFSPVDEFDSKAICYLTDSIVSHSAMFYSKKNNKIIEETPPEVLVNDAEIKFKKRTVYVRRFKDSKDLSPVISKSNEYLNEKLPYNKPSLYMIGMLLLYKKFAPTSRVKKIMIKFFKAIVNDLIKEIDDKKYPGETPMTCSQFVTNCYDNANVKDSKIDYTLDIEHAVLAQSKNGIEEENLISKIMKNENFNNLEEDLLSVENEEESVEQICEDLCKELLNNKNELLLDDFLEEEEKELIKNASKFYKIHLSLNSKNDNNVFVFPEDLLNNCRNLEDVGVIKI